MFQDRAFNFGERLKWSVGIDDRGWERDQYDDLNPLYVIASKGSRHVGSLRVLSTTGPTMINDHFSHLLNGTQLYSALIWECTRFCVSDDAAREVAAALLLGGAELMEQFDVKHFAGVFDESMRRVYRMIGAEPTIIGSEGDIHAGLWSYDAKMCVALEKRSFVSREQVRENFYQSLAEMGRQKVA